MKQIIKISLPILFFTLLYSCTEKIDIELDSTYQRIIIEASLSDEYKKHEVIITKSSDYFSDIPAERISGAEVTIGDGEEIIELKEEIPGLYRTNLMEGEVGKTYHLKVIINEEEYTSEATMMECPQLIDSIHIIENPYDTESYDLQVSFIEPIQQDNFYAFKAYRNQILETNTINKTVYTDDVLFNGAEMSNISVVGVDELKYGDEVTVEIQSIDKNSYHFFTEVQQESFSGGAFSGPPTNVNGNISNGALGLFHVYSSNKISGISLLNN